MVRLFTSDCLAMDGFAEWGVLARPVGKFLHLAGAAGPLIALIPTTLHLDFM